MMKHNIKICVTQKSQSDGILECRPVTVREKLLSRILGCKAKYIVLVPGNTVDTVAITEVVEGGCHT